MRQPMSSNETARIMAIKAAFVAMTATQGWTYFKQVSQNVVQKAVQEALDEDDPIKGESKRLYAKAVQRAVRDLLAAVEVTQSFNPESVSDDSGLGALETIEENEYAAIER